MQYRSLCRSLLLAALAAPAQAQDGLVALRPVDPGAAAMVSYARDVKPILLNHCIGCHAGEEMKSGLDVSSVDALRRGGRLAGPAILPGRPDESPLVQYLRGAREPQMPYLNLPLSEDELHVIRAWIQAGAVDDSRATAGEREAGRLLVPAHDGAGGLPADLVNALLFSADAEEFLVRRRAARLALMPPPPPPPQVEGPVHNDIDRFIVARWRQAGLSAAQDPPPVCDDATFLRRVYLDLIGVVPTIEEARDFLADPAPDRRERLIDALLARDADYAAHWTPWWEDALASANVNSQGGIPTRGNYRDWLLRSFRQNKPYDVMTAELIDPGMPDAVRPQTLNANGRVYQIGYIRNDTHTDTLQSAANLGQVFLGTTMKCASCHNHFENPEWPQARFLGLAGLCSAQDLELIRCEKKTGQIVPARFAFDLPGAPQTVPAGLDGRLRLLALMVTDPANPRFAPTIVNRLWKRYLGLGLYEPADDFREDRSASHPHLLAWLADDFMRHGYDLKHTIRLILTSRTYQLAYHPAREDRFDLAHPDAPRYFRSPALRRLTAEQLIDSMRVATSQRLEPARRLYLETASTALTRVLGKPASRNEISTARSDDVAVVQALEILNGEQFHRLAYHGRLLRELAEKADPGRRVEQLYRAAVSRPPSDAERRLGIAYLEAARPAEHPAGPPEEIAWIDDHLPAGAAAQGSQGGESWVWVSGPDHPVLSGRRAHTQAGEGPNTQHYALGARDLLEVRAQDLLFAHVYLDAADPPREIMLQWNDGSWEHRAYWGEDLIPYGRPHSGSRLPMGPLPEAGRWVRLEIPAADVGLDGAALAGMSFDQAGGKVYWDRAGIVRRPENPAAQALGDLLWALFSSPEFQFVG